MSCGRAGFAPLCICELRGSSALLGGPSALLLGLSSVIARPEGHLAELLLFAHTHTHTHTLSSAAHLPLLVHNATTLVVFPRSRATALVRAAHWLAGSCFGEAVPPRPTKQSLSGFFYLKSTPTPGAERSEVAPSIYEGWIRGEPT